MRVIKLEDEEHAQLLNIMEDYEEAAIEFGNRDVDLIAHIVGKINGAEYEGDTNAKED